MRLIFFSIGTVITFACCNSTHNISTATGNISDTILGEQLQKVIDLIPTEFASLKDKQLSHEVNTTAYSSTITLHGTFDNQIVERVGRPYYVGKIAEMKTEEQATQLVKHWIRKLGTCLHNLETKKVPYRTGGTQSELRDGTYFFMNDSHGVSVFWSKYPDSKTFNVMISVI